MATSFHNIAVEIARCKHNFYGHNLFSIFSCETHSPFLSTAIFKNVTAMLVAIFCLIKSSIIIAHSISVSVNDCYCVVWGEIIRKEITP